MAVIDSATRAALTWRYVPFEKDGHPVYVTFSTAIYLVPPERRPDFHVAFPEVANWNSLRIKLTRTACFGTCPVYSVEIQGDGSVTYNGGEYVAVAGRHRSRISQDTVRSLVALFRSADYFSTFDKYSARITDFPAYRTSISFDRVSKSIEDYAGLQDGLPAVILELEKAIDKAAGTDKWIHITGETVPSLVDEGYFKSREGDTSVLATMIEAGANAQLVRQLLQLGAPLNGTATLGGADRGTPLVAAAERGDVEIVQSLLSAGAAKNDRRQMSRALLAAAGKGSPGSFQSDANDPNESTNRRLTIRLLLQAGADLWRPSGEGKTIYDIVCQDADADPCFEARNWVSEHPRPTGR